MKTTIDDLIARRSVRKYREEQITDEELDTVLTVGTYAPTAINLQSPQIVAVQNPETIKQLSRMNGEAGPVRRAGDPMYGAPTAVVVFADGENKNGVQDASLVLGNLMNAAHAIGLGSCWINRCYEMFLTDEGKELKKAWGVEDKYQGVGICILGYPAEELPSPKPRRDGYVIKIK